MNAVVTVTVGQRYADIAKTTHPSLKAYADRIGAEFVVIDDISWKSPHWAKFNLAKLLEKYRRIIYLDTDIIVRPDTPNLCSVVNSDEFGAFNEGQFLDRSYAMSVGRDIYGVDLTGWDGSYFNTGVMVLSGQHANLFTPPERQEQVFYEQTWLNCRLVQTATRTKNLHYRLNRMTCMDSITGEPRHASYIIHYAGAIEQVDVASLAAKDMERWKNDAPGYDYQSHVLIFAGGGLGDEIDSEPVIRFAVKNVWKDSKVTVSALHPQLFSHLPCKVCGPKPDLEPDTPYYSRETMPDASKGQLWAFVSNMMCHSVDFISIQLLRRILPDADKQIRLTVDQEAMAEVEKLVGHTNLDECIAIHAGKHWPSKTIPAQWWQDVVSILEKDRRLILLGRNEGLTGVHRLISSNCIDLVDKLDLDQLVALISRVGMLVSNDSSPIHIAGSFDNWICLIPTCKHPDHILPWRHGDKSWKSMAIYKKLTIDDVPSHPNQAYEVLADSAPVDWSEYLVPPEEAAKAILAKFV